MKVVMATILDCSCDLVT